MTATVPDRRAGVAPGARDELLRAGRRQLRRLADASVASTGRLRRQPDFLVVGAQRSGTTSMFKTLVQHPAVARPFLRKGVHYFDLRHERGLSWYRGHFPLSATSQLRRLGRPGPLTGESSPYYMFHPLAPARIAADLPDVRVIALLRDPAERAYSAHAHELARGFETEPFERALELEPERLAGERERMLAEPGYQSRRWQHQAYVTRGQYVEQLRELEHHLGRDRILVVDSADFFRTPEPVFDEVRAFLALPPAPGIRFEQHNARPRSPLPDAVRDRLRAHFEPYDDQLATWWGRVPSWRR